MFEDSSERYGAVTRFFHWLVAVLVLQQFFKIADRIDEGKHWLGDTFGPYHTSIGALILILVIARLIWASQQKSQRPLPHGQFGQLARIAHRLMYFCLIVMPPLGALYIYGKGYAVKLFGQEIIAKPAGETEWAIALGEFHSIFAWLLVILVVSHIGAALYHHFIRKDDTLERML